jgi:hypothetical protein
MSPIGLWLISYMCFARSILKYVSFAFYSMCYIVGLVCVGRLRFLNSLVSSVDFYGGFLNFTNRISFST